jgi:hypothetical protein
MSDQQPSRLPQSPKVVITDVLRRQGIGPTYAELIVADLFAAFEAADIDLVWQPGDGDSESR